MMRNSRGSRPSTKSFLDVLQDELRKEIREELLEEIATELGLDTDGPIEHTTTPSPAQSAHERLELWLSARVAPRGPKNETRSAAHHAYAQARATMSQTAGPELEQPQTQATEPKSAPQTKPESKDQIHTERNPQRHRTRHILSSEDVVALEFFRRHGAELPEDFFEEELKTAFRRIALRVHPDRHVHASELERKRFEHLFTSLTDSAQRLSRHFKTDLRNAS